MQQVTTRLPIIPRSKTDPTGEMKFVRSAESIFEQAIRSIRDRVIEIYRSLPKRTIVANNKIIANRQYLFDITIDELDQVQASLNDYIDDQLGSRNADNWFFSNYVKRAYESGTRAEYFNLSAQSELYASQPLGLRMMTQAYQRRIALVRYRVFEEMKNLSADTKANMSRILSDGIANGYSIKELTEQIYKQSSMQEYRARRIARTETLTAYRRAKIDESEQARADYSINTKMLWLSAFAPTSRKTHMERHGNTYTEEEVREFYSRDANAINCMCSQVSVLVDSSGNPVNDVLARRMVKMKETAEEYRGK